MKFLKDKKKSCCAGFSACGGPPRTAYSTPPQCDPPEVFLSHRRRSFLCDKKALYLTLAVLAVFFAAAASIWIQARSSSDGKTAVIYQDGQLLRRISLTGAAEESFTIKSSGGGYNTIQIAHGKIGITSADCPDKLCVKMGMISSTGYPISCLPHKLVIQIEDTKEDSPIDATTR